MATIVILGAGVMGSALSVPAADNGHQVWLVGTHLDESIIRSLRLSRQHPTLLATLPEIVQPLFLTELKPLHIRSADLVVLGVSSPGIRWAEEQLKRLGEPLPLLALVTKGMESHASLSPQTYAETLPEAFRGSAAAVTALVGIGGPCIARELAFRQPTAVVYACDDVAAARRVATWFGTDYYQITTSADTRGVEACAALKNFMAIGVSAMISRYQMTRHGTLASAKNPTAFAFHRAVHELSGLCRWIGGDASTAFGLAGLGDLHVTVGGGRNSRLGVLLGEGQRVTQALTGALAGETVEGVDTGRVLAPGFYAALTSGDLVADDFPLTRAILRSVVDDDVFDHTAALGISRMVVRS